MASAMSAAKGVGGTPCEDRGKGKQTSETLQTLGLRHPTSDFARIIYYLFVRGGSLREGSGRKNNRYQATGGFGNSAPFSNTCANYGYLKWVIWRSFGVSSGRVSRGVPGSRFVVVLEAHLGSFGNQLGCLFGAPWRSVWNCRRSLGVGLAFSCGAKK